MRHYFQQVVNPGYGAIGEEAPPPYHQEEPALPQPRQEALRPDGHLVALPAEAPPVEPTYDNLEQVVIFLHIWQGLMCKLPRSGSSFF